MIIYIYKTKPTDTLPAHGYCRETVGDTMWYWKGNPDQRKSTAQYSHDQMLALGYRLYEPAMVIDEGF